MKKYLLTGLVILMPVALTAMIIMFLFDFFTEPFVNIVGKLFELISQKASFNPPPALAVFISRILALILLCIFIFLLGMLARWFLIKNLLSGANKILSRIPLIKTVYKISKDIISALFSTEGKKAFKYPVLIPFPHDPSFCLGFQAGEVAQEIKEKLKAPVTSIFIPTAPHPISGFLVLVPEKDVHKINMSNEEAVKYLVSCGLINPDSDSSQNLHNIL